MFELRITQKQDHFTKRSWFELFELESGEVIFDHESEERVESYAKEFVALRPGQYKLSED